MREMVREMGNRPKTIGFAILSVVAALFVILGLVSIALTLVADADERELYRNGKVVDAVVVIEEIYTARTFENMYDFDGFSDLARVKDWWETPSTRRTRYRYQLDADGIRFTLRNRLGTQRLRTGTTVAIVYDPQDVPKFRLYMGKPQPNTGFLLGGLGLLAVGTVGVILLKKYGLW